MNCSSYCITTTITGRMTYVFMCDRSIHSCVLSITQQHKAAQRCPVPARLTTPSRPPCPLCVCVACSHTSGSMCLGNSEVVRYLYKILMSSCSSPLLKHQESSVKVWPRSSAFSAPQKGLSLSLCFISRQCTGSSPTVPLLSHVLSTSKT